MIAIKEYVKKNIIGTQYEWESHFENITYLFTKYIKEFRPDSFLDVGCGDGERTMRIAKYFNIDLIKTYGLDQSDWHINEGKKKFNAEKIDLETTNIPYSSDTFELVICNQVFEHLKNYKNVMFEIIRVTKNGGYIVLGVPNLAHLINRVYLLFGMQPMCIAIDSVHVRGFTHKGFTETLKTLEKIKLINSTGSLMYPLPYSIAKYLSKFFVGLSGYTCYLLQKTEV